VSDFFCGGYFKTIMLLCLINANKVLLLKKKVENNRSSIKQPAVKSFGLNVYPLITIEWKLSEKRSVVLSLTLSEQWFFTIITK